jgi:uncharacterized protein YacL
MALWLLRAFFILVAAGYGVSIAFNGSIPDAEDGIGLRQWIIPLVIVGAFVVVGIDAAIPRKRIDVISSIYFGILIGGALAFMVTLALTPLFSQMGVGGNTVSIFGLFMAVLLWYVCTSVLLQTKDDFRFVIPYVEFAKEVKGYKPYVLDTSVVIDGRIADVIETGILDNQLIMPRFVLAELQAIADSNDKMRRARGRRGLDILNRLRSNGNVDLTIYERETPEMTGQPVDMKLVLLASNLDGKIVTGDYNLNKVARLHNVPVVNLNDIANSLKPVFLPGEAINIRIVKPGEEQNQGVGYLDDGTMVVVESGRDYVNKEIEIAVTSVLQTSAGRMIFGKFNRLP